MDSVLSRLASRNQGRLFDALSLENSIIDAADYCDSTLITLDELSLSADTSASEVVEVVETQTGLDKLLCHFTDIYKDEGLTLDSAKQLQVSVESYLRTNGIDISYRAILPSFESSEQYSAELKDTRVDNRNRIVQWLVKALQAVLDTIRRWWTGVVGSKEAMSKYIDTVSAKVTSLQGSPTNTAPVKLGSSVSYVTARTGVIAKPDRQITETDDHFSSFLIEWGNLFDKESHILKNVTDLKAVKIEFVVGRFLEVTPGSGIGKFSGAKTRVTTGVRPAKNEGPVLTISEMEHGLSVAKAALASFSKIEKEIARMDKQAKACSAEATEMSKKYTDSAAGKTFSDNARALAKAFQLCSNGLTTAAPHYLKSIRANVGYIALSTRHYDTAQKENKS